LIYVAENPGTADGRLFDIAGREKSNVFVVSISYFDVNPVEILLTSSVKHSGKTKDSIKIGRRQLS